MSDIYIKPLINTYGSSEYVIMDKGIRHPLVVVSRIELQDMIAKAESAMEEVDEYLLAHPAKEES